MTATNPEFQSRRRIVRVWLLVVAALVFAVAAVGGATRLTGSGLSIVEWRPVTGALPPLSEPAWQAEFAKYKTIPQYQELNRGMSLEEFKVIYWWEWGHRLLGRLIGVAFLLPFLWFLWKGWIEPGLRPRLWTIFGLGALQGAVGWWMVIVRSRRAAERVAVSAGVPSHARLRHLRDAAVGRAAAQAARSRRAAAAHPARRAAAGRAGARADLPRRAGRRLARRPDLQHLAVDRRRTRAGDIAAVLRASVVAKFLREHADGPVQPPHDGLRDRRAGHPARRRRRAHGERRGGAAPARWCSRRPSRCRRRSAS